MDDEVMLTEVHCFGGTIKDKEHSGRTGSEDDPAPWEATQPAWYPHSRASRGASPQWTAIGVGPVDFADC